MSIFYTVSRRGPIEKEIIEGIKDFPDTPIWNVKDIFEKQEVLDFVSINYPNGLSQHGIQYMIEKVDFPQYEGNNFAPYMWTIEFIFEMVRQIHFPNLPSRFISIFGCIDLNSVLEFRNNYGRQESYIYKVECKDYFKADMNLLKLGPSLVGSILFAKKYWQGESTENPFWEYFLQFPVQVIELVTKTDALHGC
jgi:hypothetical protein